MARIVNLFAVRECGKIGNADIYANSLSGWWQGFRFGHLANKQRIPAVNTARDPKLFALSFNRAGESDATCADTGNCEFVAFDRARPNLLVLLRESVIPVLALESGKSRFLSILNASKEALESFLHTFKRILLDCPQMALYFGQRASFSQMARLLVVTEGCARDLVTGNPLGQSGVIDLARMFKLALTRFDKAFVDAKLKFVSLDCSIFGISHRVQCANHYARGRDLVKGCNLSSGRFSYTTIGQSIKQQNSEGNALRKREIV
jgi:hypothetical protein